MFYQSEFDKIKYLNKFTKYPVTRLDIDTFQNLKQRRKVMLGVYLGGST